MLLTTEQLFHSKNVGLLVLAGTPPQWKILVEQVKCLNATADGN